SGDLDFLFAEEAPRVEAVYLISRGGLLVESVVRKETELSPDIFASMLTGVVNFTQETLSALDKGEREGSLNALGHGDNRILIQSGGSYDLATILTGKENEFLINDMREILRRVDKIFGNILQDWDGRKEKVEGVDELLMPLIESGKYEGVYYGRDNPKARRDLLFESVSLGLVRKAQTAPTVICLEDLQWADPSSLALMHYVARNTKDCGLLLLGTYRPEDVAVKKGNGHPLTSTMRLMSKENLHKMVQLQRLPQNTIDDLLSSILGEVDFEEEFKIRMYRETEGNPLFIIQLIKLFVEEGIISRDNGSWKLVKDYRDVKIPSKIHNVVARRLDRVRQDERRVLDYASVVGETFASTVLADALDIENVALHERLGILEKTHQLVHPDNGNYRFDHSRIKEVLYNEIPTELRMEYHSIVASSIEAMNEDNLDEVIGDLAFHYYECRNREKALHYLILAAEEARKEYSNEEAIRFYGEILELEQDQQKRVEYLEALGDIYYHVGNYDMSISSYQSALELAGGRSRARIMGRIGGVLLEQGKFDESKKMCTEALELVKGEDCQEEALALRTIGTLYSKTRYLDQSREWYEQSLRIDEKIGNQTGIAGCLNNIGVELLNTRYDEGLGYLERALEINRKIGDQRAMAGCLNNIGIAKIVRGDYDGALECYEKGLGISERIGNQSGIARMVNNVGEMKL
ncbi:MAG: tetratricopeptide repeat protein, partial [Thermoplasmata archaeon]|nr:tetratricopeptide repeat protein [Thermoplasmata archaeon]